MEIISLKWWSFAFFSPIDTGIVNIFSVEDLNHENVMIIYKIIHLVLLGTKSEKYPEFDEYIELKK